MNNSASNSRGVLLLALGSSQYGCMAANVAASIRFSDKQVPIHLVYSGNSLSHLRDEHRLLLTSMTECPPQFMQSNGAQSFIKAKTCLYQLSPFDETLFLDADLLWFGKTPVSTFMESLAHSDFTMQTRGYYDYSTGSKKGNYMSWCNERDAQRAYNLTGKLYHHSSEVVWFRKTKQTRKLFNLARNIFDKPKIKPTYSFMGGMPDELAYNIAANKLQLHPQGEEEVFIYWDMLDRKKVTNWSQVLNSYYGYSMGGNNASQQSRERYEQMAKAHATALKLPYHFKLFPKKQWDRSRIKI